MGHWGTCTPSISNNFRLCEFHKIYNFDAVEDRHEVNRFSGQKIKIQGHSENTIGLMIK